MRKTQPICSLKNGIFLLHLSLRQKQNPLINFKKIYCLILFHAVFCCCCFSSVIVLPSFYAAYRAISTNRFWNLTTKKHITFKNISNIISNTYLFGWLFDKTLSNRKRKESRRKKNSWTPPSNCRCNAENGVEIILKQIIYYMTTKATPKLFKQKRLFRKIVVWPKNNKERRRHQQRWNHHNQYYHYHYS